MATLAELRTLFDNADLRNKVGAALIVAAQTELASVGSANGRAWSLKVLRDPKGWADIVLKAVLAQNAGSTLAQIQSANDTAIQTNVNDLVAKLIDAEAGV